MWTLIAVATGVGASTKAAVEIPSTEPAPPTPSTEDPVAQALGQDNSARLTLPVDINGKGPYAFLVDTGSDRSSISRELAVNLALPTGPSVLIHGTAGADTTPTAVIDRLTVGGRTIEHVAAPTFAFENLGASGMIGADALSGRHLVIDFKQMKLLISESRRETIDKDTVVIRGRNLYGRLILSHAAVQGSPVLVFVDTGSQITVGNPAMLKLLSSQRKGEAETAGIVSVTGQRMVVNVSSIGELELGGFIIRHLQIGFGELETFKHFGLGKQPALLLGMDVLSRFRKVTIDVPRREATFALN